MDTVTNGRVAQELRRLLKRAGEGNQKGPKQKELPLLPGDPNRSVGVTSAEHSREYEILLEFARKLVDEGFMELSPDDWKKLDDARLDDEKAMQDLPNYTEAPDEPSMVFSISELGKDAWKKTPSVSIDCTFGELISRTIKSDPTFFSDEIPDFWSRRRISSPTAGDMTMASVCWELQRSSTHIADVLMKKDSDNKRECIGIETVSLDGDYVIVVFRQGQEERGVPIHCGAVLWLPPCPAEKADFFQELIKARSRSKSAQVHIASVFPGVAIKQVKVLVGTRKDIDPGNPCFAKLSLTPRTSALLVEVRGESWDWYDARSGEDALSEDMELDVPIKVDKGKGRAMET